MTPQELYKKAKELGAPAELLNAYMDEQGLSEPFREDLELLRKAEELGAPAELLNAYKEESGITEYREQLEGELQGAEQNRQAAERSFDAATDTPLENLQEGVQTMAYGAYMGGTGLIDLFSTPLRMGYNAAAQSLGGEGISSVRDLFPEEANEYRGAEEPIVSGLLRGIGEAPLMAGGFAPAAGRSLATTGGATAELLGFGTAEAGMASVSSKTFADVLHQRTAAARANEIPIEKMSTIDLSNDFQVKYWANRINEETIVANNLSNIEDVDRFDDFMDTFVKRYERAEVERANASTPEEIAKAEKKLDKLGDELAEHPGYKMEGRKYNLGTVMREVEERFKVPGDQFIKALKRAGGPDDVDNLASVVARDRIRRGQELFSDTTKEAKRPGWFDKTLRPVVSVVRERVGQQAASKFEKAFETSARNQEKLFMWYAQRAPEASEVRHWADSQGVKAQFLDLQFTGKEGLKQLARQAKEDLSQEGFVVFNKLVADMMEHNAKAKRLYREDVLQDEVFWPSTLKPSVEVEALEGIRRDARGTRRPTSVDGTQVRLRRPTFEEEDLSVVNRYENPFKAALDRMSAEQNLIQLSEKFNMVPALSEGETTNDFFNVFEQQIARQTSEEKAALLRHMMEDTVEGSRQRPHKALELFMKQAYAGTLGQFDSALLNLHDVFVSAWRSGVKPTLKAMIDKERMDIRQLGITNDPTSLEEFRAGFDGIIDESNTIEDLVDKYSKISFKWSGFQSFDRYGKGVAIRAAHNAMRDAAKQGKLVKRFGYLMDEKDLAYLTPVLKDNTPLGKLTGKRRELMEELLFARLGEQQLISMAGRPLNYLRNPNFRTFWAMSGFAIKQADMLKMRIIDEVAKGNYAEAGKAAAGYLGYVAFGFALADTARNLPSYMITGDDAKEPTLERLAIKSGEQAMAAVSLNKLSPYALQQAGSDPYAAAVGTLEPPGGLIGNVSKDIGRAMADKEFRGYVFKSVPLFGDFMYDWWNENS